MVAQDNGDLGSLPVQVVFQAGRLEMYVSEIDSLAPGMILTLDRPVEEALDIIVNGRKIGRGGLVKVGDALAVRVTRLTPNA
jgi:type III secretion protein Q